MRTRRRAPSIGQRPLPRTAAASAVAAMLWLLSPASPTSAHGHDALAPRDVASAWTLDWPVIIALAGTALVYILGVQALWERAGRGRGIRRSEAASFAAGLVTLAIALASPLDAMSDALFSAHMAQHMLLMLVAAPLLVLGRPGIALAWALPVRWSRAAHRIAARGAVKHVCRVLAHPAAVWATYAAGFWLWHTPALFDLAERHATVHAIEHVTFVAIGVQFWWLLMRRAGRRRFEYGVALVFVFTTMLQQTLLGALLTFSNMSWYGAYGDRPAWHLDQITDQRLAGLIMWMSSNALYLVVTGALLLRWLQSEDGNATERAPDRAGMRLAQE